VFSKIHSFETHVGVNDSNYTTILIHNRVKFQATWHYLAFIFVC